MTTPAEAAVIATADMVATARKSGRNPKWPYVPVVIEGEWPHEHERQLLGKAFATRAEAVAYAETHIERFRTKIEADLAKLNMRALRAQYGVDA